MHQASPIRYGLSNTLEASYTYSSYFTLGISTGHATSANSKGCFDSKPYEAKFIDFDVGLR